MAGIRSFKESDIDDIYQLYRAQTAELTFHHNVRRDQFRRDLFTSRFIRKPEHHHAKARVALVVERRGKLKGFVSGGYLLQGDEVVPSGTAYIQAIIAESSAAAEVKTMLRRVVAHLRRYNPKTIVAHDACLCPVFYTDSAGHLPTAWAWMGQCLADVGFDVRNRSLRLVADLSRPRRPVATPDTLKFIHLTHEMFGFESRYDFGCLLLKPPYEYGDGVVWCGNFYSGAFVKGTAFRSLYMNYFTVLDDAWRGKGLGRLVLQHCLHEARARGAKYASLATDVDNFVAQNLYQSEGFRVTDAMHSFELKSGKKRNVSNTRE